jgi:hypothetical protein
MSVTKILVASAAAASAAAGVIHFAAAAEHAPVYPEATAFFVGIGVFQVVWAAMILGRPSRILYAGGVAASLTTIALWAVSRTTGLPFGPEAFIREAVGRADVISTLLEEGLVLLVVALALGAGDAIAVDGPAYRGALASVLVLVGALAAWALTGLHEGHGLAAGAAHANVVLHLGHHGLHLLFAGGAVSVFGFYLVARVRRGGWPAFSWRLSAG